MNSLTGKYVVVTRAPHQSTELATLLRTRGAIPLLYPCIDIALPEDPTALDEALRDMVEDGFDWIVFTSQNTVHAVSSRLNELGLSPDWSKISTAAVGTSTVKAVLDILGLTVDLLPEHYTAASLGEKLSSEHDGHGGRVLLPQSAIASSTLPETLAQAGMEVIVVTAYTNQPGQGGDDLAGHLQDGQIDAITFTSSSTVENFLIRTAREQIDQQRVLQITAACIGPSTAETARAHRFTRVLVPEEYTLDGLVTALEQHFQQ